MVDCMANITDGCSIDVSDPYFVSAVAPFVFY